MADLNAPSVESTIPVSDGYPQPYCRWPTCSNTVEEHDNTYCHAHTEQLLRDGYLEDLPATRGGDGTCDIERLEGRRHFTPPENWRYCRNCYTERQTRSRDTKVIDTPELSHRELARMSRSSNTTYNYIMSRRQRGIPSEGVRL